MRVLLLAKSKYFVPPEHLSMMVQGFTAWRNQYRGKMEEFFFFAGRAAGGGILNVADEAELNQIVNDWPFAPFSEVEIMPIVDGDVALKQFQSMAEKITAQMGG